MSTNISLLERIRNPKGASAALGVVDRRAVLASIRHNLERILASRVDHAAAQLELGLPSLNVDEPFSEIVVGLRQAIIRNLLAYEPRLDRVNVLHVQGDGQRQGSLVIDAMLKDDHDGGRISIEVTLDRFGHISVKA